MKKLVSLFIIAVMLLSLCTVAVYAQTDYNSDVYDRFVYDYGEPYSYEELFVSLENNEPSYYVIKAKLLAIFPDPPLNIQETGIVNNDLVFTQIPFENPFLVDYAVYDVSDDEFYDITKVDFNDYEGLYDYLVESKIATMIGDVDYDRKITIMDATMIQRILANITSIINNFITDFDRDGFVVILDATAVQKKVANLSPVIPTVNEELVYTPYNDDFNINDGILDIEFTSVYDGKLDYGDHNMDSNDFGVIIKSTEHYKSVFKFYDGTYDDEFFKSKALVATVNIVTDYYMTNTIGYVGVYGNTLVLVNNVSWKSNGNMAYPIAPPYVSIVEVNKNDVAYVNEIVWIPS